MLEKKITNAVLSLIRSRQSRTAVISRASTQPVAPAKLREARFSDLNEVAQLKLRWGLSAESVENWNRLWHQNPSGSTDVEKRPIGWVLEADGHVVGYLGNISLRYHFRSKVLRTVAASAFVVDPPYRAISLSLISAFFRQKSVDLFLSTTAIDSTAKIARAFKADALPQKDYDTVLFWVLRSGAFAQAVLKKLAIGKTASQLAGMVAAVPIVTDRIIRKRWPKRAPVHFKISEISPAQIGDDFESLFADKLETGALVADRSPAVLRWHFEIPGHREPIRVLCCRQNQKLVGYLIVRDDEDAAGLRRTSIADLMATSNDPVVLRALLIAAYDYAKRSDSDVLELLGFPQSVRQICLEWSPYQRKYPLCPFYYKAADPELHRALSHDSVWYASPYDGDTSLVP